MQYRSPVKQVQKDFDQNLSDVEANCHGNDIDFVSDLAFEPVSRSYGTIVFTMANNGLDSVSSFLSFSDGFCNALFLAGKDDFCVIMINPVIAVSKVDIGFLGFDTAESFNLSQSGF